MIDDTYMYHKTPVTNLINLNIYMKTYRRRVKASFELFDVVSF